ncbi:MAG: TIGR04013 family B12-binding domain/radical SAM domain-containing protein [Fervidobacterium sp.]|uniref:B12-binding domain/radical SAM domain protein, MJ_1487 family n=1 Tax=Fervidobacterium gondwanense DSM 13020 TaxID=1121883 RepID=A0A1M7SLN1_FERGO|nr:TIGR04013 family B12-binding domain/radical SAM domain-containing protein [Fervidobacterium gondwanense]SHN59392.1 B12-binding domain/radical SAM domain protein, MJ_1487 family [Fervidobacterium gondwanense DSM 13020]
MNSRFKRIVFRTTKHNRYSVAAIVGAILSRLDNIEVLETKDVNTILQYPATDTVVAFSFMTFDIDTILAEVRFLKENGYTTIAGGPHATALPQEMLNIGFDYVFVGDGEENIVKFLCGEIPESRIFDGIKQRVNLDDFPAVCEKKKLFMPIEISRGCPFDCGYCQTPRLAGKIVRHRSIEQIVEYERISVKHNKTTARFITPNAFGYGSKNGVTPRPEIVDELLYKVKSTGVKEIYFGTFPSDIRPESITDEMVKVVKKYVNHDYVVIGAQSGSNRILNLIRRGHTVEKVEEALEILAQNGFYAKVDFIFGFPFETKEDVEETFNFINKIVKKYKAKIHAHTFMPLPGTPLWNAGPGVLYDYHYKFLGQLASQGILDGYWVKQEELAKKAAMYSQKVDKPCNF